MSLYNNVASTLSGGNLLGDATSALGAGIGKVTGAAAEALGGGPLVSRVGGILTNTATGAASRAINRNLSPDARNAINLAGGVAGDLLSGDWNAAGLRVLDSGMLNEWFNGIVGLDMQAAYWGRATPMFGGISPAEAKRIYDDLRGHTLAKKNLFLIEVSSDLYGDISDRFNMFAVELEYSPYTIAGEKRRVNGTTVDTVQGAEPMDLSIVTMDDQAGTLRKWFAQHMAAVASESGTVGVPAEYAIRFKIVHSFVTAASNRGGYEDIGLFRPVDLNISLSRREDGLHDVQMKFTQLDPFMRS